MFAAECGDFDFCFAELVRGLVRDGHGAHHFPVRVVNIAAQLLGELLDAGEPEPFLLVLDVLYRVEEGMFQLDPGDLGIETVRCHDGPVGLGLETRGLELLDVLLLDDVLGPGLPALLGQRPFAFQGGDGTCRFLVGLRGLLVRHGLHLPFRWLRSGGKEKVYRALSRYTWGMRSAGQTMETRHLSGLDMVMYPWWAMGMVPFGLGG
ncbi:hypothetical protein V6574_21640 [Streptomyces sp. SM1P]